MAIPFEEILAKFTPEERGRIKDRSARLIRAEHARREVREILTRARSLVAGAIAAGPAEVDRLEEDADRYLGALREMVRSLGGELDLVARFPDRDPVRVVRLGEMEVRSDRRRRRKRSTDDIGKV